MKINELIENGMKNGIVTNVRKKTKGVMVDSKVENAVIYYTKPSVLSFTCSECGEIGTRRVSRFENNPNFICMACINRNKRKTTTDKMKATNLKRYGNEQTLAVPEIREKGKKTNLKKYGVENVAKNTVVKDKMKATNLKRYGSEQTLAVPEIREKGNKTNLKKYGAENISQATKNKIRNIKAIEVLGFTHMFDVDEYGGKINKSYKWKCNKCETIFEDKMHSLRLKPRCLKCNPYSANTSQGEKELQEFTNGKKYRDHFEIDALVDTVGFEFDGLYWHSEKFKEMNYHIEKTNYFKEKGINVYHIFEDEWNNKKEIVKSIINSKLNRLQTTIYGRKCVIKEVDSKASRVFQDENHIQGFIGSKVRIGLYYEDELVSLMTFGKNRFNKKIEWELLRFVNKKNTRVLGGASKCFKHFVKTYNPINILSYSDTRLFGGEMYGKLGFKFTHNTTPNYYYIKSGSRYNRMKFQKHKLKDLLEDFDIDKTERQMMRENNFLRIYDCGMKVWVYENNESY